MAVSETERRIRARRRIGCGIALIAFAALLLLAALTYMFFLRPYPNPPLDAWIPADSDAAASVALDAPSVDLAQLIQILSPNLSHRSAEIQKLLDVLLKASHLFLHPRVLLVARIDPEAPRVSWALVANLKRAQTLLAKALKGALGDSATWSREAPGALGQRFTLPGLGWHGALWKTQVFLSNDQAWLDQAMAGAQGAERDPMLTSVLSGPAPVDVALVDAQGRMDGALAKILTPRSTPLAMQLVAKAREWLGLLEQPARARLDLWPGPTATRLVLYPRLQGGTDAKGLAALGEDFATTAKTLSNSQLTLEPRVIDTPDGPAIEMTLPELAALLAKTVSPRR
ncbi:MAG: hypothetical protein NTW86_32740 [Candidatus Sumerlaeota bacterium]|nr:hypothetical protein [Candidatus Sumerlaeota bacterium]